MRRIRLMIPREILARAPKCPYPLEDTLPASVAIVPSVESYRAMLQWYGALARGSIPRTAPPPWTWLRYRREPRGSESWLWPGDHWAAFLKGRMPVDDCEGLALACEAWGWDRPEQYRADVEPTQMAFHAINQTSAGRFCPSRAAISHERKIK